MKLTFLGSGSAFTLSGNYHSNILLSNDEHSLLLDCGSDIRFSVREQGLSHKSINAVYISHFHADHCGGLEWLGFQCRFDPSCKKPIFFTKKSMADRLWDHVLSGGMSSFLGEKTQLGHFFDVTLIGEEDFFTWEGVKFQMIKTFHVMDNENIIPNYGLFFSVNNYRIFITFDMQFLPDRYMTYYQKADLIFHDCETRHIPTGVHAHYKQLLTLPENIRNKMWLYHYDDGSLPDAKLDGFKGFVTKGQTFNLK